MLLTRETLSAFSREMQKIAVVGDTIDLVRHQGELAADLLHPNTAASTVRHIYRSSSNMHPAALQERAQEIAKANSELRAAGTAGRYVDDIAHGGGWLNKARSSGWLANFGKYEGPSKFLQARNALARALPGQRSLLAASVLPTAYSSMKKTDETGRVRGAGERALGTAGALAGTLATQAPSVMRLMGQRGAIAGALGQLVGGHLIGKGLSRAGQIAGQKLDTLGRAPAPTMQPPVQTVPTSQPAQTV